MLHYEVNRRSSLSTSKTLANIFSWRYIKRGVSVFMKRAQSNQINTSPPKCHEIRHYINNLCSVLYTTYCILINHNRDTKLLINIVKKVVFENIFIHL